jgi:4-aminobutyrate aminotransferase-like enzyme
MVGVEFSHEDGSPAPQVVDVVKEGCLKNGVLLSRCGPYNQVLRLAPPLIITAPQVDHFLEVFGAAIASTA